MKRLDSLECERAAEELTHLVDEGFLDFETAQWARFALLRRAKTEEAQQLFDEDCKHRVKIEVTHTTLEIEADDFPAPTWWEEPAGDEEIWLPYGDLEEGL